MMQAEVLPDTVGQFTGLLDRYGEEIYESDIVQFEFDGDFFVAGPVKWRQEVALWAVDIGMALNTIEPEDLWIPESYEVKRPALYIGTLND